MATLAKVACRDDVPRSLTPRCDNSFHGRGREIGAVGEYDHRRLDHRRERREPATKRCARAALPVRALDDPRAHGFERVSAGDYHDFIDWCVSQTLENVWEEKLLLGSAEACRGSGGQDDGAQHADG